jgi:hypothetical protein
MVVVPSLYALLGVEDFATLAEVRRSYRKLALALHPDRHVHSSPHQQKRASEKFVTVAEAYAELSEPKRKKIYDAKLQKMAVLAPRPIKLPQHHSFHRAPAVAKRSTSAPKEVGIRDIACPQCRRRGRTQGKRGESSLRCQWCSLTFCESSCPGCSTWSVWPGLQGCSTRNCKSCSEEFHEAFCATCCHWSTHAGQRGQGRLSCPVATCDASFYELMCQQCRSWGSCRAKDREIGVRIQCAGCKADFVPPPLPDANIPPAAPRVDEAKAWSPGEVGLAKLAELAKKGQEVRAPSFESPVPTRPVSNPSRHGSRHRRASVITSAPAVSVPGPAVAKKENNGTPVVFVGYCRPCGSYKAWRGLLHRGRKHGLIELCKDCGSSFDTLSAHFVRP